MTFDDYKISEDPLYSLIFSKEQPEIAINAFLDVFKGGYRLLHSGYQVTLQLDFIHLRGVTDRIS